MPLPAGFELTTASGNTLESSEVSGNTLTLRVHDPARRSHQFLIALERTNRETKVDAPLLEFNGAQRETGEVLVEGLGAMEMVATESGGLRRMDVREASAITRSLSHFPLQAAFRYNRRATDAPKLQLEWRQFSDADVLSAVAERATVTTLTTVEGRSLTEISLRVRNHAKAFMKVDLPAGAQLLSAEIEDERVKPVLGPDGSRVPLLRAGLDSSEPYTVSFVYLSSGTRFGKSGAYDLGLAKLDIPVSFLTWELSLPDRLQVKQFGGNALSAKLFPASVASNLLIDGTDGDDYISNNWLMNDLSTLEPGQIGGVVVDPTGALIPNAEVTVTNTQTGATQTTTTNAEGHWMIAGMQPGPVKVSISHQAFKKVQYDLDLQATKPARIGTTMEVAGVTETVTITDSSSNLSSESRRIEEAVKKNQAAQANNASQNVFNLQRRVAGILPVAVEVPRSGKSYFFVRPLVLEEETRITFQYKTK
jgi:Carboxypeptidase regulatory-like domain